jgi:hypothetical protein
MPEMYRKMEAVFQAGNHRISLPLSGQIQQETARKTLGKIPSLPTRKRLYGKYRIRPFPQSSEHVTNHINSHYPQD